MQTRHNLPHASELAWKSIRNALEPATATVVKSMGER